MSYKRNTDYYSTRENLLDETFWLKAQIPVSKWSDFAALKHDPVIVESFITKLKSQMSKLDVNGLPDSLRFLNGRSDLRDTAPSNALFLHYWNMAWTLEKLLTVEIGNSSTQLFTLKYYMREPKGSSLSGAQIIDIVVSAPQRLALALTPRNRSVANDNFLVVAAELNECIKQLERLNVLLDPDKTLSSDLILGAHVLSSFAEAYSYTTPLMNHLLGISPLNEQLNANDGYKDLRNKGDGSPLASVRLRPAQPIEMTDIKEILTSQHLEVVERGSLSADYKAAHYILGKECSDVTDPIFHQATETLTTNFVLASKRYLFDVTAREHMDILYKMTQDLSNFNQKGSIDVKGHLKRSQIFIDSVLQCTLVTLEKVFYLMTNFPGYLAHLKKTSPILCAVRRDIDHITSNIDIEGLIGYPRFIATGLYTTDQSEIDMLKLRSKEFEDVHEKIGPYLDQQHRWMSNDISEPSHRRTGMNIGNKLHYSNIILSVMTTHTSTTFVGPRTANPRVKQLKASYPTFSLAGQPDLKAKLDKAIERAKKQGAMVVRHSYEHTLQSSFGDEDLSVRALLSEPIGQNGVVNLIPDEYYLWFMACYGERKSKIARRLVSQNSITKTKSSSIKGKDDQSSAIPPQEVFEIYIGHTGYVTVLLIPGSYEIRATSMPGIAPLVSQNLVGLEHKKYTTNMLEQKPIALLQVVDYKISRSLPHDYTLILDKYIAPRLTEKYDGGQLGLPIADLIHMHDRYTPHSGISLGLQTYTTGGSPINTRVIGNCFIPGEVYHHGMIDLSKESTPFIPIYLVRNFLKVHYDEKASVGLLDKDVIESISKRLRPSFTAKVNQAAFLHNCWCEADRYVQLDFLLPSESVLNYEHVPMEFLVNTKEEFVSNNYAAPGTTSLYLAVNPEDTSLVKARVYVDLFQALQYIPELQVSLRGSVIRRAYEPITGTDTLNEDRITFADPFVSSMVQGFTTSDSVYNPGNLDTRFLLTRERRSSLAFFDGVQDFIVAYYTQLHQLDYDLNAAVSDWFMFMNTLLINLSYFNLDLSASVQKYSTTMVDTIHGTFESALRFDTTELSSKELIAKHLLSQFPNLLRTPTNMTGNYKIVLEGHQMNFALDVAQISRSPYPQIVPSNSTRIYTPYALLPMVQDITENFVNSWIDSFIKSKSIQG